MHTTALASGRTFFERYAIDAENCTILEIGSMDVNGSLRQVAPVGCRYIGVDCAPGRGVDIVSSDPYRVPLPNGCADAVVSSSCFEHAEFFWLLFLEMCRLVRMKGYLYINSPSNGPYHAHPVDCWRFREDAGLALVRWAGLYGYSLALVETYISEPDLDVAHWQDWVCIWRKTPGAAAAYGPLSLT